MNWKRLFQTLAVAAMMMAGQVRAQTANEKPAGETSPPAAEPMPELAGPPAPPPELATVPQVARPAVDALARKIDAKIDERLSAERVSPSPLADDAEFLRRVWLDLAGKIPSSEEAAAFLASRDPNKRAQLIDDLVRNADFGRHHADIWQSLLIPRNSENRRVAIAPLTKWFEARFNANRPWNETVQLLLTAEGSTETNAAVTYYLGHLLMVDRVTDNVSRLFLGLQLQCAQCHNHPFTGWKQDEYWGMAAFFTKVRVNGNPRQAVRQGGALVLSESNRGRPARLPESAKRLPPKFLQGDLAKVEGDTAFRPVLADWLTRPDNPYFARAFVNRTWHQLFGRGIINPVDDMHDGNPASHPELLNELAAQWTAHHFDVKFLYRAICSTQAYQRSSKPHGDNADAPPELFARMAIKPLSPEQLYDSLVQVMGSEPGQGMRRRGRLQQQRDPNASIRTAFVAFFGNEEGNVDPTEYQAGIPQVLRLMNGPFTSGATFRVLGSTRAANGPADALDQIYLRILSRRPTATEQQRLLAHLDRNRGDYRQAMADIVWALLNSSEFALNR